MLNFLNLKRLNARGIKSANKHVMMSALTYNLKKLMKHTRPKAEKLEMAMFKGQKNLAKAIYIFFGPKMGLLTAF